VTSQIKDPQSRPKLLLVDDEQAIQSMLKALLEREGYDVTTANNGKMARDLVGLEDFNVVISDIHMPDADGIELLKYISGSNPKLPVILMTGFTKIIETKAAFALGAKAFLAKPFNRDELRKALADALGEAESKAPSEPLEEIEAEGYCRIAIEQFISGKTIKFEIFVRLSDAKYIKVAHTGEDIDLERIRAFKGKGVEFLYIKKSDFAEYVSRAAQNSQSVPREKKLEIAKHASAVIMENLFVNGVNADGFYQAKETTETTLALLSDSKETFDLITKLSANGDPIYSHSLGVSLFSTMLAKQVGWDSPATLFKISTAGLFHDIGLKEIDRMIVDKPRSELSLQEIKELETHPAKAVKILGSIPAISGEILQAILQHHESLNGLGYPSKLPRSKIIPLARLISVADEFCELAIAGPNSPGLSGPEAVERLTLMLEGALDSQFLKALKVIVGAAAV
jgi:response regulator RpfG family c-di-GMP phosphodiesterase